VPSSAGQFGKSTLVNALVGEERVIASTSLAHARPIEVPFERAGRRYTLIDTAGLRRRGKTGEGAEFFSSSSAAGDRGGERRCPPARGARRRHRAGCARRRYVLERGARW